MPGITRYRQQTGSSRSVRVAAQFDTAAASREYLQTVETPGPAGRFMRSRLRLVQTVLADCPGGDLVDIGCGPGILTRTLLRSRPGDFRITALDLSPSMIRQCVASAHGSGDVHVAVGNLERLPFKDGGFDVAIATGVLEYADVRAAVDEVARVVRPGGLVVVSMLNPKSLYRIVEWFVYWPLLRILAVIERSLGVPLEHRHGGESSGIRAVTPGKICGLLAGAGMVTVEVVHFDVTPLVPPVDRIRAFERARTSLTNADRVATGWKRWLATGYLVVASRSGAETRR
jgi:2-polyprenyl-3-methyl-5-hydroxy-6-metoxy-1,4-benzoquinol methylase